MSGLFVRRSGVAVCSTSNIYSSVTVIYFSKIDPTSATVCRKTVLQQIFLLRRYLGSKLESSDSALYCTAQSRVGALLKPFFISMYLHGRLFLNRNTFLLDIPLKNKERFCKPTIAVLTPHAVFQTKLVL